jgi:hypothetical protein
VHLPGDGDTDVACHVQLDLARLAEDLLNNLPKRDQAKIKSVIRAVWVRERHYEATLTFDERYWFPPEDEAPFQGRDALRTNEDLAVLVEDEFDLKERQVLVLNKDLERLREPVAVAWIYYGYACALLSASRGRFAAESQVDPQKAAWLKATSWAYRRRDQQASLFSCSMVNGWHGALTA